MLHVNQIGERLAVNDQPKPARLLGEIDLAHVRDFELGRMRVRPSAREIEYAGSRETLEPRIMQVLVALTDAAGAVVSRDDLIVRCWEGRVVGEDAINRAIGRLRRLSELDAGQSFVIETVPRVGYRLTAFEPPSRREAPAAIVAERSPTPLWRWLATGAIVLTVLAIATGAWWLMRPPEWTIDSFRMVVATPLFEADPSLAPNGAMIAYSAGTAPFARHIYIRNLSNDDPIALTDGPNNNDLHPVWSPDGSHIAFVRHREGIPCTLLIKPVPAGDERVVGHCTEDDFTALAWSPTGDALYYADRPRPNLARRIMRLDLASGSVAEVTHPQEDIVGDRDPLPSPDGRKLAYVRLAKGIVSRTVLDLASGNTVKLPNVGDLRAWTGNDTLIATGGGIKEPAIWIVPLNGAPQKIAVNSEELGLISAGPGGQFAVETFRDQIVLASPPQAPGTQPQILEVTSGVSILPEYSMDGRLVFVRASPGGQFDIWVQRPGETPHKITDMQASMINGVRWSPDGKRLAFFARIRDQHGIFVLNADGTGLRHLEQRTTTAMPSWTADSKSLILPMKDAGGWRLWRVALDQPDHAAPVSSYGWFDAFTQGDAIYALGARGQEIWRIDGVPKFVARYRRRCTDNFIECQTWFVSGDTLVFADHTERANPKIVLHSLKDGSERTVLAPGLVNSDEIALDPTTGKLLYAYDGMSSGDIALFHLTRR